MTPHPVKSFEIVVYYQNEPWCTGVLWDDLPDKIKHGAYIVNLDEYHDIGTHWVLCIQITKLWHTLIALGCNVWLFLYWSYQLYV